MQDDQKGPLPVCANNVIKVPLWIHTAAFPGFSHKSVKLEKTLYKNAKNKLKSLSGMFLFAKTWYSFLPYMVTEINKSDSACLLVSWLMFHQT